MKMRDFEKLVNSVTYKPGWQMVLHDAAWFTSDGGGDRILRFFHQEPDSDGSGKTADAINQHMVEADDVARWDKAQAIEWLGSRIMMAERHEFEEFFKIDGQQIHDPHPEVRPITAAQAAERYGRP